MPAVAAEPPEARTVTELTLSRLTLRLTAIQSPASMLLRLLAPPVGSAVTAVVVPDWSVAYSS